MNKRIAGLLWLGLVILAVTTTLGASGPDFSTLAQDRSSQPDDNLPFLFAAYAVTWAGFFSYAFYISRRQSDLRRELESLREQLAERPDQAKP